MSDDQLFLPSAVAVFMEHFDDIQDLYYELRPTLPPDAAFRRVLSSVFSKTELAEVLAFIEVDARFQPMMVGQLEEGWSQIEGL